jgi:hypothetical protein
MVEQGELASELMTVCHLLMNNLVKWEQPTDVDTLGVVTMIDTNSSIWKNNAVWAIA